MDDFIDDDEEEDLYSDLPNFKYDETVDKLQAGNKELQARVLFLEDVIEKQTKELDGTRSQCETLTKNISSLLKTAQNEIKRKDNKINELNKMVLELKTEILTLRKRKLDEIKPTNNEEPDLKQQKLDNTSSVKSTISPFFCSSEVVENPVIVNESPRSKIDLSEKQYAPDIKCHTVYSKRMYNKIYNIRNSDSNIKTQPLETKNNDEFSENNIEVKLNTKLENKNIVLPQKTLKERISAEQSDQSTLNLQVKETIVDSLKISNSTSCNKNSKPLFDILKNGSLISDNKKASIEPAFSDVDRKQITSASRRVEVSKEVNNHYNELSPTIKQPSSKDFHDEAIEINNCTQENKRTIISRVNRSANFPKTEKISKDVSIKHFTQTSRMSSLLNKDKESNLEHTKFSDKTDEPSDKVHEHGNEKLIANTKENVNSQFSKSYSLKKSKKSIKSVICPISGEWSKNTEAVVIDNSVEMDISKKSSPNGKTEKEDLDIIESLFGSPLKWTENSFDESKPVEKLCPPATAFEDSCSAHIENLKFKETRNNVTEVSETKITELSLTKKFSYTERKCYFQPSLSEVNNELPQFDIKNKSEDSLPKDIIKQSNITYWPFKKTNNDIPFKNRSVTSPTFSSFVNTESTSEACDVPPSLKGNPNTSEIVNSSAKFLRSPKYNDSVLGQFDDTTQLINALAKDPSKLSPIHTPIKEPKTDSPSPKPQSQLAENCAVKPSSIPVDENALVQSGVEENKLMPKEPISSVGKKKVVSIPKSSLTVKKSSKSNINDNKISATKPLISKVEKKLSIPASVISSVEKKLSFPFSVLSPADKKIEKKTILLEQPINILCPRKTPRQIGSCKRNILSKKENIVKDMSKNNKDELNCIKSPSPSEEKTETRSIEEINTLGRSKDFEGDGSDHKLNHNVCSKLENNRNSKSPTNMFLKNQKGNNRSTLVSEDRETIPVKTSKKDRSPVNEKIKHSYSRKENIPRRRDFRSPMKEKSPSKFRRDQRPVRRDFKPEVFKRPLYRRESFKRPNCHFRQSSVERKIAKDWRHSAKTRSFPEKIGNVSESTRTINCKVNKITYDTHIIDSREGQSSCYSTRTPLISRSSRISWSSSTGVVSTKTSNSECTLTPQPEMKWILRPIDFDIIPPNTLKESSIKSIPESTVNIPASSSNIEIESPINKFLQSTDSSLISLEKSSPSKSIVIVAKRRPVKFGANN